MTDKRTQSVSVVVATLNGVDILRKCLEGLFAQERAAAEVIVVDNGSTEDVAGFIAREFPAARLVRLEENAGFAAGYNAGIRAASGDYIAIINNDAVASRAWLDALVAAAEKDASVGAVASVIVDGTRPEVLDSCGVGIALDGMSRQAMRGLPAADPDLPKETLLPSGCACLYRSDALKEVGLFDEDFFAYCEDTDLGLRLRWAGWTTAVAPGAVVTHYYSKTAGRSSLRKLFWVERNHYWVAAKNFPLILLPLVPLATLWRFAVQAYLVAKGDAGLRDFASSDGFGAVVTTVLRAHLAALVGCPSMIRKRLKSKGFRRLTGSEMAKLILKYRMSIREILAGPKNARN